MQDRESLVESGARTLDDHPCFATDVLSPDTAPPIIRVEQPAPGSVGSTVRARVHNNKTPNNSQDWAAVEVHWSDSAGQAHISPMTWYGENLFRAEIDEMSSGVMVCATDAAGNQSCS